MWGIEAVLLCGRKVAGGRWIIDRGDIKADRVGRWIQIDAAIGGAAVIAHLEGEGGNGTAIGVGRWCVGEGAEASGSDFLTGDNGDTAETQGACTRQAGEDHALQAVGSGGASGICGIGEAEIGRREAVGGVFQGGDGLVGAGGGVVHRREREGDGVGRGIEITAAACGAAVVAHLEGERGNPIAVGVGRWDVGERGKIGGEDLLCGGYGDATKLQVARSWQGRDDDALQAVRAGGPGGIGGIGETEIGRTEGIDAVFEGGDGFVAAGRRLVDRGDIDADRVGRGIQINATIGGAAVVAHLEGEGGVAVADYIRRWREGEGSEAGSGDLLTGRDCGTTELQGARSRQAGEDHALQAVGPRRAGSVDRVGEAEIGRRERIGAVFGGGDRAVGAGRRVIHRGDIEADRVGRGIKIDAAIGGAAVIAHPEGEGGNGAAVGVGRWRVDEVLQGARSQQAADEHAMEAVGPGGASGIGWIGEAEIRWREAVGGVFQGGDGLVGAGGGVVHRADRDRERAW